MVKYGYDGYVTYQSITGDLASTIGEYNPFRYKGYYYDKETGLFYCCFRYYNPKWGRWLQPDSIEYLDPESINGLNLYAYCGNDPINYADPSGHFPISALVIGIVLGAVFGGVTSGISSALEGNTGAAFWGDVLGGALIGAAFTLGGFAGAGLISAKVAAINFGVSTVASFGAGVGANVIQSVARGEDINWQDALIDGAFTAAQSVVNFWVGGAMSYGGYWKSLNTGAYTKSIGMFKTAGQELGKSIINGSRLYLEMFGEQLLGRTLTKFIYSYPWSYLREKY